jgi:toxin ParE1/3/4
MNLIISARARRDLQNIATYTAQTYGSKQMESYIAAIEARLLLLTQTPYIGASRDDIRAGFRASLLQRHLIIYTIESEYVNIIGLPHASMDVASHFDEDTQP